MLNLLCPTYYASDLTILHYPTHCLLLLTTCIRADSLLHSHLALGQGKWKSRTERKGERLGRKVVNMDPRADPRLAVFHSDKSLTKITTVYTTRRLLGQFWCKLVSQTHFCMSFLLCSIDTFNKPQRSGDIQLNYFLTGASKWAIKTLHYFT